MKKQTLPEATLGIFVTSNRVEAVLLRPSGGRFEVLGRFVRQRLRQGEKVGAGSLATVIPGLKGSEDADFTIQVGDGSGTSTMFLSSEFAGLGVKSSENGSASPQGKPVPFAQQLTEILAECRALGYEQPRLAFCVGAPDVSYLELFVARDDIAPERGRKGRRKEGSEEALLGMSRRSLLQLLAAQHQGAFDEARVAFLPMTPLKGQRRFAAIVPEPGESVTATLEIMRAQKGTPAPSSRLIGAELSLYTALARQHLDPAENENTVVVRITSEDTLIVFLSGKALRHFERLRSLTAYDPPETICSRVLLQQDEQKIGDVHHVLVLSEGRTEQFLEAFRKFYRNAAVAPMQSALFKRGLQRVEGEEDGLRASAVPAAAIGLELLEGRDQDNLFRAVNLLPKKLRQKPRQQMVFAWHTFVMLAVLFGATYFFTTRYFERKAEIEKSRLELQLNPPDPTRGSPAAVQARVDSLKQVYRQYTHALHVLDSLLVGSDQWSRTLEKTARATDELSGVWFEAWQPNGSYIRITGNARSRTRVAQFANRLDGEIESTSFEDVGDVRIYPFTMIVPRPIGMPRVADYLEDMADGVIDSSAASSGRRAAPGSSVNLQDR